VFGKLHFLYSRSDPVPNFFRSCGHLLLYYVTAKANSFKIISDFRIRKYAV
jgi:hypothetical protein